MFSPLLLVSAIAYGGTAFAQSRRIAQPGSGSRRDVLLLAAFAVGTHALHHGLALYREGPDFHFFSSLSLVAMAMAAVVVLVAIWRPVEALGIVVFPIAALFALTAMAADGAASPVPEWQIALHIVVALLAFAVLAIAALIALMLEVQERALRAKRIAVLRLGFPPLTLVESLLFHMIGAGFVLLSVTVLSGTLFIHDWFAQHVVHKTVLTLAAWVVFGTLLFGRWRWGWRGRRAVRLTLAGMLLLLLAYFGSLFVREIVLGRGA
jgi:ABC-type uncharacterized transport system permease subunit